MVEHSPNYLFTKRQIYYFCRRVPVDLKDHYKSDRITLSLRTKSLRAAQARALILANKLDEDWFALRWRSSADPFSRFILDRSFVSPSTSSAPLLTDARDLYKNVKGKGRPKSFYQAADRAVGYVTTLLGDRPIDVYQRADINLVRDALAERGLQVSSLKRNFSTLRAIVNFASREHGLEDNNAFSGLYLGEVEVSAEKKRPPIPTADIKSVQTQCKQKDDEARWLVALVSDTGTVLIIEGGRATNSRLRPGPTFRTPQANSW